MKEYKRETGQEELQKLLNDEVNQRGCSYCNIR